jgi:lipoprotein signal peptidase
MSSTLRARRRIAATGALAVLALDLADSALARVWYFHPRPASVLALAGLLGVAVLALAPRVPSLGVALGGGVAAGGAFGTLVAAIVWRGGVPDPIVQRGVAFNLADVAIVLGDGTLLGAALFVAWRNRGRLGASL